MPAGHAKLCDENNILSYIGYIIMMLTEYHSAWRAARTIIEKFMFYGSLCMNCLITPEPLVRSYSCWQGPWSTIDDLIPSS